MRATFSQLVGLMIGGRERRALLAAQLLLSRSSLASRLIICKSSSTSKRPQCALSPAAGLSRSLAFIVTAFPRMPEDSGHGVKTLMGSRRSS